MHHIKGFFLIIFALLLIPILIGMFIGAIAVCYLIGTKYGAEIGWATFILFVLLGSISSSLSSLLTEIQKLREEYQLNLFRNSEKTDNAFNNVEKILDSSERIESLIFDATLELKK